MTNTRRIAARVLLAVTVALGVLAGTSTAASAATGYRIAPYNWSDIGCMGISTSSNQPYVGKCGSTSDSSQRWYAVSSTVISGSTYYQYKNGRTGLCLGVHGGTQEAGAQIVEGKCSGTSDHSQFWRNRYVTTGTNNYEFVNGHSGWCMYLPSYPGYVYQDHCGYYLAYWYTK